MRTKSSIGWPALCLILFTALICAAQGEDNASLLMIRGRGVLLKSTVNNLVTKLGKNIEVHTLIDPEGPSTIHNAVEEALPQAVIVVERGSDLFKAYRRFQRKYQYASSVPVIYVTDHIDESRLKLKHLFLDNCLALTYHPPLLEGISALMVKTRVPVKRVGVIYRAPVKGLVDRNRTVCAAKGITVETKLLPDRSPNIDALIEEALNSLKGVDALWLPYDVELLEPRLVGRVWTPTLAKLKTPTIVADCNLSIATVCIAPNSSRIASDIAARLREIQNNSWRHRWSGATPLRNYIEKYGLEAQLKRVADGRAANYPFAKPAPVAETPAPDTVDRDSASEAESEQRIAAAESKPEEKPSVPQDRKPKRKVSTPKRVTPPQPKPKPVKERRTVTPRKQKVARKSTQKKHEASKPPEPSPAPAITEKEVAAVDSVDTTQSDADTIGGKRTAAVEKLKNVMSPFNGLLSENSLLAVVVVAVVAAFPVGLLGRKIIRKRTPVTKGKNKNKKTGHGTSGNGNGAPTHCLIVGDKFDSLVQDSGTGQNTLFIQKVAQSLGMRVTFTSNNDEAKQILKEELPAVLCLDEGCFKELQEPVKKLAEGAPKGLHTRVVVFNAKRGGAVLQFHKNAWIWYLGTTFTEKEVRSAISVSVSEVEAFQGTISGENLIHFFQMAELGQKTGTLVIDVDGHFGAVSFSDGRLVYATAKEMKGEEAVGCILGLTEGTFKFVEERIPKEPNMDAGVFETLLEYTRQKDEESRG
ncbi:MAG: DUF4388 domain-containing protein [Chitinivibrionales bacterium]|nr:DUF4388 domain-containing protein [Chitinivibrionales bacterium]MBD3355825.1 DUF4388 domain-containing protein [Chitinivibrionales bacterium]